MTTKDAEAEFASSVTDLIRRGQLAVFAGAGISIDGGGFLVADFLSCFLGDLELVEADRSKVLARLPFEAVLQELEAEEDIQPLMTLFDLREPASTHILLARLVEAGLLHTIATTNFDRLIEVALDLRGLQRERDYVVFRDEISLAAVEGGSGVPSVMKLHGSVEDPTGVAITLSRVASRTLSAQRRTAIDYLFGTGPHSAVLVLGYSCSDVFDITPQIIAAGRVHVGKTILFIDHQADADSSAVLEPVSRKTFKNPFSGFAGIRIRGDTRRIIRLMWEALFADELPVTSRGSTDWRNILIGYLTSRHVSAEPKCSLIAGRILHAISEFEKAESRFRTALQVANRRGDVRAAARAAANAGACCVDLGEYENARRLYEAGMRLALGSGDRGSYLGNRMQLANVHHSCGRYDEALELFHGALREAEDLGSSELVGTLLGNIAAVLHDQGRFLEALEFARRHLEFSADTGDKTSEAYALHRLGMIQRELGDLAGAIRCHSEGLEIAALIGNPALQSQHLGELGVCSHLQGDYATAIEHNSEALRLAREAGNRRAEGNRLANLGRHYRAVGKHALALEALQAAVAIAREIGDRQGESNAVGSLGLLHRDMGNLEAAYRCQEEALRITREIGDRTAMIAHLTNLGMLSIQQMQIGSAREFLTEAAQLLAAVYGADDARTRQTVDLLDRLKELYG